MPSATGQEWEKYSKTFADDEEPEKKITPLSDEYVLLAYNETSSCQSMSSANTTRLEGIFRCSKPMVQLHTPLH